MRDLDAALVANVERAGRCAQAQQPVAEYRLGVDLPRNGGRDGKRLVQHALLAGVRGVDAEDEIGVAQNLVMQADRVLEANQASLSPRADRNTD
ncbi:MAG TPA: hypothetical protein VLN42_07005 [Casimicrobiaceae bacterium]|nr:hypothetical protein [Casimicrobiaceae bacterium]